jgi:dsRNA-specific ribonuclease
VTTPGTLLSQVLAQLQASPEPRMREVMTSLVRHLHEFAAEVRLTDRLLGTATSRSRRTCSTTRAATSTVMSSSG